MIEVAFGYRDDDSGMHLREGFNFTPGDRRLAVPAGRAAGRARKSRLAIRSQCSLTSPAHASISSTAANRA